jgi:predicted transcriptional regulator
MQVTLTPQAEQVLRQQLARSPDREPAQIVEEALTEMAQRQAARPAQTSTSQDFHAWLRELRQGVEPVPDLANETWRREAIYQGGRGRHLPPIS